MYWRAAVSAYGGADALEQSLISERLPGLVAGRPELRPILSPRVFERLSARRTETAAENLLRLQHFDEVANEMIRHGVRFMPMKGCDLIGSLYADPGERPTTDIDVLVHPNDFARAAAVAVDLGYKDINYPFRLPGAWPSTTLYRKTEGFIEHLDLHYCPGPEVGRRRLETCRLFSGWESGKRPSPEQQLLFSVIHHQNHFFKTTLGDLYETLLLTERSDLYSFMKVARRWDVGFAASVVFARVAYLFGIVGPTDGWRRSVVGYIIKRTADKPTRGLFAGGLAFALSTDRPAVAVKLGARLFVEKYLKTFASKKKPSSL